MPQLDLVCKQIIYDMEFLKLSLSRSNHLNRYINTSAHNQAKPAPIAATAAKPNPKPCVSPVNNHAVTISPPR